MKANYGYKDGSGEFFITVNTDRCTGCGRCAEACRYGVMEVGENEMDPLAEEMVAFVTEAERKKIKYTCNPCKGPGKTEPCIAACEPEAIVHSW